MTINGQDVENVVKGIKTSIKEKPVSMTGNIGASAIFNTISGIDQRRDPFNWNLNANINFSIAGIINAPFSFYLAPGNDTYNLPSYRFAGISPSYKWIKLHIGDRSMNFSRYSFAGHTFFGIGTELTPGRFQISGMYGRLQRAVPEDINVRQNIEPAFKRMAYGTRIAYEGKNEDLAFTLFHAWDDVNSIPRLTMNPEIRPANNTILGLEFSRSFGDKVGLDIETAYSAFNRDSQAEASEELSGLRYTMLGLFKPNASSNFRMAFNTNVNYLLSKRTTLSIGFERVDPNYRTLGSLFFNNDYENYTGAVATNIANGKLTLSVNAGIQKNNLDGKQLNAANRFIGSINANYMVSKRMALNASYSNFRNTNKLRFVDSRPDVLFDSLVLALVNQNLNLSAMYQLTEDRSMNLVASFSFQNADQIEDDIVLDDRNTTFYLGNISLQKTYKERNLSWVLSFQASYSDIANIENVLYAPTISVRKKFFDKKLVTSVSTSFISQFSQGEFANSVINVIGSFKYRLFKNQSIGLSTRFAKRGTPQNSGKPSFNEFTGRLNYGLSF
jgi:hypothetical protein